MALSPFDAFFGDLQGRLIPVGFTPGVGTHSFVLGANAQGLLFEFNADDEITLSQTAAFDDVAFVRLVGRFTHPTTLPAGWTWQLRISVASDTRTIDFPQEWIDAKKTRFSFVDIGVNVEPRAAGPHAFSLGLRLTGPGPDPVEVELPELIIDALSMELAPAASVLSTEVAPFAAADGDTLVIDVDGGGNATATFSGTAANTGASAAEPYALTNNDTLEVLIDGASSQTVTMVTGAFVDIAAATAAEVVAAINLQINRGVAIDGGTTFAISSDTLGSGSLVQIVGGAANAVLVVPVGPHSGTGNVPDLSAMTVADVKTVVEAAIAGLTVFDQNSQLLIRSNTTGVAGSIQVDASSTTDIATSGSVLAATAETYALVSGDTLFIEVDGAPQQTIQFFTADFIDIANATAAEVATVITTETTGATAADSSGAPLITSDSTGAASLVDVVGGSASALFLFPSGTAGRDAVFGFDNLLHAGPTGLQIYNRLPQPTDNGYPVAISVLELELADLLGDSINTTETQVYVEGVLAYDGTAGGFQAGFMGANSALTMLGVWNSQLFQVDLSEQSFISEQIIDVRVVSENTGDTQQIDETYTFILADITAPDLLVAAGIEKLVIQIEYTESVTQVSATNANDALNPANYTFERSSSPAVNITAASVASVNATTVNITTDIEQTPGASYLVRTTDVEDVSGNPVVAPDNEAAFLGFTPDIPATRSFDLYRFMPLSIRQLDQALNRDLERFIAIIQEVEDLILCLIDRWSRILDPDSAPENFIDAMLLDLANPFFDLGLGPLSTTDKRRLVFVLVQIYKQKGTCKGLKNAIRFFVGVEIDCEELNLLETEWELGVSELSISTVLGQGDRFFLYAFRIISEVALTAAQRTAIDIICEYMKPAHTHCLGIIEPAVPDAIDHLELGLSELGETWILH